MIARTSRRVAAIAVAGTMAFTSTVLAQGDARPPRPTPGPAPAVRIPHIQMRSLRNGIQVAVLEDHEFPVIDVQAIVMAPSFLDPGGKEGVSALTAAMLAEGTTTRSADAIANAEADLGTPVSATGFNTIPAYFEPALAIMADELLNPAFPAASLERLRANTLARLIRARSQATYLAGRVFRAEVYGVDHPYARSETEGSVRRITRADLVAFHRDYYRPRNVRFIVAGDITPDQAVAALDRHFDGWAGGGKDGWVTPLPPPPVTHTAIYLYNRPTSPQSVIVAGAMGPRRDSPDYYALDLLNTVLGGAFNSRLNLSLREVHGYTYGASSFFEFRRVPQPSTFAIETDVATPKTDSSVAEILTQVRELRTSKPVTDSELNFAKRSETLSLPLQFATIGEAADAAAALITYRLPLDYYDHLTPHVEAVTLADVRRVATEDLHPDRLAIIVVGDRKVVRPRLEAMHLAPIVDVDSLPVAKRPTVKKQ